MELKPLHGPIYRRTATESFVELESCGGTELTNVIPF